MPHDPRRGVPLLFVVADTGGGHRAAARAVEEALDAHYPGQFRPVQVDPLGGPGSSPLLRWVVSLYGPSIRLAPWTWGAVYYATDSARMVRFLHRTVLSLADRPLREATEALNPGVVVTFHPLVGRAAERARGTRPLVTVVTDLITPHAMWRAATGDRIVPSASIRWRFHLDGVDSQELGLPIGAPFTRSTRRNRGDLRRRLGLRPDRFLVVVTGGGEGSGSLARRIDAILDHVPAVDVVAICGRNDRLRTRLEARHNPRLHVTGFVDNMADWVRAADLVVGKAGPGTIAEATACGTPLLLTSHVPGQEKGNTEFVVGAGAGVRVPTAKALVAEVTRLHADPRAVDTMRAAASRLARPDAASEIAHRIAAAAGLAPLEAAVDA
jgi:1,2-diacylglycerol 3-beta-galactosyltransferase